MHARRIVGRRTAAVCSYLLLLLAPAAPPAVAQSDGVQWSSLGLEAALAQAEEQNTLVMVNVFSDHCGQCQDMEDVLWNTPAGAELTGDLIALRIASDQPESMPLRRICPILGLPLVVFLEPDGTEVGRVVGFRSVESFLQEARPLSAGVDPLPTLEEELAANPDSKPLIIEVLSRYYYRQREAEAEVLLQHLLTLDKTRQSSEARRGLMYAAKYYDYFRHNSARSQELWHFFVEEYANSPAVSSGIKATFEFAQSRRTLPQWRDWICDVIHDNPKAGRLCYYSARFAHRAGMRDSCLAAAARTAVALGIGPAHFDSVAAELEP